MGMEFSLGLAFQDPAELKAVHAGQHDVKQHQIRRDGIYVEQKVLSALKRLYLVPLALEVVGYQVEYVFFVIYYRYELFHMLSLIIYRIRKCTSIGWCGLLT